MSAYQPIACAAHERLEFAVLRRQRLNLAWRTEAGVEQRETVLPIDVATRAGAEWLTVKHGEGQTEVIRLDRILSATESTPPGA
jgi:Rho-binding antiterminator